MARKKVIALRGAPIVDEQNTASAAITPGNLVEINTGQWRKHATAGGAAGAFFALERDEMGRLPSAAYGTVSAIDRDYGVGDRVKVGFFHKGERVNAIVASGEVITEGAELQSDGAGRLTAGTTKPVARAAEAHAAGSEIRCAVIVI